MDQTVDVSCRLCHMEKLFPAAKHAQNTDQNDDRVFHINIIPSFTYYRTLIKIRIEYFTKIYLFRFQSFYSLIYRIGLYVV